jgi:ribonucleotide reductase beta subunit family protein with ferritin-like domain
MSHIVKLELPLDPTDVRQPIPFLMETDAQGVVQASDVVMLVKVAMTNFIERITQGGIKKVWTITDVKYIVDMMGVTMKTLTIPTSDPTKDVKSTSKDGKELVVSTSKEPKCFDSKLGSDGQPDSVVYSMFPMRDYPAWVFFCKQEAQLWRAKEIPYVLDQREFPGLKSRYKELYYDLLGFFAPGDGLVSKQVLRYLMECTTYSEMAFFAVQLYVEAVHSEGYGMAITATIPDKKEQEKVFGMVDNLPCVKAKAAFIKKYIDSTKSRSHRFIAGACSERIFFVTLFAIIFHMREKNIWKAFVKLNEQVSKDETLHGDFNCNRAEKYGLPPLPEILEIIDEAVKVEIEHVKYILRKPIDTEAIDAEGGMTVENLSNYARLLGDQVLILLGVAPVYNAVCNIPCMGKIALQNKTNFYEGLETGYKMGSLVDAIDWEKRAGLKAIETNAVSNPNSVDF